MVKAGKARYIGASSMFAWQFAQALYIADANGWTRFVSMQNHYNLLYREEEREMLPLCADQGVGVDPLEPAGARSPHPRRGTQETASQRDRRVRAQTCITEEDRPVVDVLMRRGGARGVPAGAGGPRLAAHQARVVTAPIVGATKPQHLDDAIDAVDLRLDEAEIAALEKPYRPHRVLGHR